MLSSETFAPPIPERYVRAEINNWNQGRKMKLIGLELLSKTQSDQIESKHELEYGLKYNLATIEWHEMTLGYLENNCPYTDSLEQALSFLTNWESPYLTFTTYEILKTKGIGLIQNDSIEIKLVQLYEKKLVNLINDYDRCRCANVMFCFPHHIAVDHFSIKISKIRKCSFFIFRIR